MISIEQFLFLLALQHNAKFTTEIFEGIFVRVWTNEVTRAYRTLSNETQPKLTE